MLILVAHTNEDRTIVYKPYRKVVEDRWALYRGLFYGGDCDGCPSQYYGATITFRGEDYNQYEGDISEIYLINTVEGSCVPVKDEIVEYQDLAEDIATLEALLSDTLYGDEYSHLWGKVRALWDNREYDNVDRVRQEVKQAIIDKELTTKRELLAKLKEELGE